MAAAKEGVGGEIISWSRSSIDNISMRSGTAGYMGEAWLAFFLAIGFSIFGLRHRFLTGGFGIGWLFSTWIAAMGSDDFTGLVQFQLSHAGRVDLYPQIHAGLLARWSVLCLFLLTIALIVVIRNLKKEKARH